MKIQFGFRHFFYKLNLSLANIMPLAAYYSNTIVTSTFIGQRDFSARHETSRQRSRNNYHYSIDIFGCCCHCHRLYRFVSFVCFNQILCNYIFLCKPIKMNFHNNIECVWSAYKIQSFASFHVISIQ